MPILPAEHAVIHEMHGSQFASYVAPSSGSRQLCAWRTELEPGTPATPHTVSHEEVFLVLEGTPTVRIGTAAATVLIPGSVVFVPAATRVAVSNDGPVAARMWVTAAVGLTATTDDGLVLSPPWTV